MTSRLSFRNSALGFALLAICLFFSYRSPQFLSSRNLSLLLTDLAITATLALGMLLVILPGHIDLSAGSGVGLTGGLAAVLASGGEVGDRLIAPLQGGLVKIFGEDAGGWVPSPPWPAWSAMLVALAIALALWSLMGTLIVRERIPAFIITLGGLLLFKGLFWLVIESRTIPIAPPTQPEAVTTSHWLHLGDWSAPIWQVARDSGGGLEVAFCFGDRHWPLLTGTGNAYSLLSASYVRPAAGFALATLVVLMLIVGAVWGHRRHSTYALHGGDGERTFMGIFIAAQALFLLILVANRDRGLPLPAVLLGLVASSIWVLTTQTTFGRYLYAIGGNEEAALVSGVPVKRVVILAFMLMGGIVALTGLLQTAYGGASTTTVGESMELDAVAACVIGGVSLRGGRGTVLGVLFGAIIMAALINGMTLLTVAPEHKLMARGLVLILAVWMDVRLAR